MQGLELAEKYYEAYGRPMLETKFADVVDQTAAGLVGQGSECFGFDDAISTDHDFGPSFCIWLPCKIYAQYGAQMQEAYDALPKEFMGYAGRICEDRGQGRVFEDRLGAFSNIRTGLLQYYPQEVWIRRIAQSMAKAAQSGQYNYARAMKRGDRITAELFLAEFIREAMQLVYLLNRKYAPYGKWMRKGIQDMSVGAEIGDMLELLYQVPDPTAAWEGASADDYVNCLNTDDGRILIIEAVCNILVQILNEKGLSDKQDNFLQNHLQTVLEKI